MNNEYSDVFTDLWPLFLLSCGIAFLFRNRVRDSYKGRSKLSKLVSDIINAVCTGVLAVCSSVLLSLVWPDLVNLKVQICTVGLMSGYGMNFINRIIKQKLGLSSVDVSNDDDILDAKRAKNNGRQSSSGHGKPRG